MRELLIACLASLMLALPVTASDTVITGGKVVTNTKAGIIENGVVVIHNGNIETVGKVGEVAIPDGAKTVDATGKWVTPGLFAPFSRVGMVEVALEPSTDDTHATKSGFSIALSAGDAFNPQSENVGNNRIEGVTRLAILPSPTGTVFGGRGAIADTSGYLSHHPRDKAFVFVEMGEGGANIAGGSRSASWAWLRQAMREAQAWRPGRANARSLLGDADAAALQKSIKENLPFLMSVERAVDIQHALAFARQFRINLVLVGATEGWIVADEIAKADMPVIIDPHDNLPEGFEDLGATMYNAELLHKAGVKVAIADLHDEAWNTRLIPQHAGNTMATGMPWQIAFKAITSVPAQIFGLENKYGALVKGMVADVVVWDGDPLELMSSPDAIWIGGKVQSMESRQTRLRDRYMGVQKATTSKYGYSLP